MGWLYGEYTSSEKLLLLPYMQGNVKCAILDGGFTEKNSCLAVTIDDLDSLHRWAIHYKNNSSLQLLGTTSCDLGTLKYITPVDLQSCENGASIFTIPGSVKIKLSAFGEYIWEKLQAALLKDLGKDPIADRIPIDKITYSDRYCNSPLTITLLGKMLYTLRKEYGSEWNNPAISIFFSQYLHPNNGNAVYDDWDYASQRNDVVNRYLPPLVGPVKCMSVEKKQMRHARRLRIDYGDGQKLTVWLDQGMGFLNICRNQEQAYRFPFNKDISSHVEYMNKMDFDLITPQHETLISAKFEKS